jgi:hypothetical protein
MLIKSEIKIEQVNYTPSGIMKYSTVHYHPEFYVNGFGHHIILATGLFKTSSDEYFTFNIRNTCDFSGLTPEQIRIKFDEIKSKEKSVLLAFGFPHEDASNL